MSRCFSGNFYFELVIVFNFDFPLNKLIFFFFYEATRARSMHISANSATIHGRTGRIAVELHRNLFLAHQLIEHEIWCFFKLISC